MKTNRTTISTLLLLAISGAFLQCRKSHAPSPVTKQSLVGTYRIGAMTTKDNTGAVIDLHASLDDCQKDDLFQFNLDGSYIQKDAGISCSPSTDDTGTWSLPASNKILIDGITADITSFDGKKLVMTIPGDALGIPNPLIETLDKQ